MSMHNQALCMFCEHPKSIYADKTQWFIHLSTHREAIIQYIVDHFEKCPLGAYPKLIKDKTEYASHMRWTHTKKELYLWAYHNLVESQITVYP